VLRPLREQAKILSRAVYQSGWRFSYGTQHFVVGVLADTIPSFQTTNRGAICFIC
jgi:hypothetical protein